MYYLAGRFFSSISVSWIFIGGAVSENDRRVSPAYHSALRNQ
jgi:hypothetical protein